MKTTKRNLPPICALAISLHGDVIVLEQVDHPDAAASIALPVSLLNELHSQICLGRHIDPLAPGELEEVTTTTQHTGARRRRASRKRNYGRSNND